MLQLLSYNNSTPIMNSSNSSLPLDGLLVGPNDIICARNSVVHRHPGNQRYTAVVQQFALSYHATSEKTEKMAIRRKVAEIVKEYGGRFVRYDEESGSYIEITDKNKVREKIAHALRAADPKKKVAPSSSKQSIKKAAKKAAPSKQEEAFPEEDELSQDEEMPAPLKLTPVVSSFEWNSIFERQQALLESMNKSAASSQGQAQQQEQQPIEFNVPEVMAAPEFSQQQQPVAPVSAFEDDASLEGCFEDLEPIAIEDLEPLPMHSPCASPSISIEDFDNLFSSDEEA